MQKEGANVCARSRILIVLGVKHESAQIQIVAGNQRRVMCKVKNKQAYTIKCRAGNQRRSRACAATSVQCHQLNYYYPSINLSINQPGICLCYDKSLLRPFTNVPLQKFSTNTYMYYPQISFARIYTSRRRNSCNKGHRKNCSFIEQVECDFNCYIYCNCF